MNMPLCLAKIDDYPASAAMKAAITALVQALVVYTTEPILMHNGDGELGVYWDNDEDYADIEVNGDFDSYSLFMKQRGIKRKPTNETFIDSFRVEEITGMWVTAYLRAFQKEKTA